MPRNELTQPRGTLTQPRGTLTQPRGALTVPRGEFGAAPPALTLLEQTALEITTEAVRGNADPVGRPLPLAASWNTGEDVSTPGFTPTWQLARIAEGKHLLPWFQWPYIGGNPGWQPSTYYDPMAQCAALNLPISLRSTQWETYFGEVGWIDLPLATNPNIFDQATGNPVVTADPLGPLSRWSSVTSKWTTEPGEMATLQATYPNPPLVLLLSNNEYEKHQWTGTDGSQRWRTAHGVASATTDEFKQEAYAEGYVTRYRALTDAMKAGLANANWRSKAICIGYEAAGSREFGVWGGYIYFSFSYPGHIVVWHRAWDGSSPPYYVFNGTGQADFITASPQIYYQSQKFMVDFSYSESPNYWYEMGTWDGFMAGGHALPADPGQDMRAWYASIGQTYTPTRYAAMCQYGLWLLQPRLLREYRNSGDILVNMESWFLAVIGVVDRVWTNSTLTTFWRSSTIVNNAARVPPFNSGVPAEYASVERNFLLTTNLDPTPWPPTDSQVTIPVFSLARLRGTTPNRTWLVYAHSPLQDRTGVVITVPGFGNITVAVTIAGNFYLVSESGGTVVPV